MISKGTWVQIRKIVLEPNERASNVPEDTAKVPLLMWVKGRLLEDGELNAIVSVKTMTGRIEEGFLVDSSPSFRHDYGDLVPENLEIAFMVKRLVFGERNE